MEIGDDMQELTLNQIAEFLKWLVTFGGSICTILFAFKKILASSSNSGYNTALVPTSMFSSSGLKILINDEASYVAGTFTESGNNVLFRHSGRTNTGYIQYIYGITI